MPPTTPTTTTSTHYHLLPPPKLHPKPQNHLTPPPTTTTTTATGLQFSNKLQYLISLKINPQKALTLNPHLHSTHLSTLRSVTTTLSSFGLSRSQIARVLNMYPSLLTTDPDLTLFPVFDFLINEALIPFPRINESVFRCPRLLVSPVDSQLRPALSYLQTLGFTGPNRINSRTVLLLVYNVDSSLMRKVDYLMSLGFDYVDVKTMVVRSPGLLTLSVEKNLGPKVEFFVHEMIGDLEELKKFPQFFSFSLDRRIKPRLKAVVQYGLSMPLHEILKVTDAEFDARVVKMQLGMVR